jgi:hypothetical protein
MAVINVTLDVSTEKKTNLAKLFQNTWVARYLDLLA